MDIYKPCMYLYLKTGVNFCNMCFIERNLVKNILNHLVFTPKRTIRIIYWSPQPLLFMYYCCVVAKSYLTLRTHGLEPTRLLHPWDFPGKNWLPFPSPGNLPNLGIKSTSSAWAGGLFTAEPPGKPFTDDIKSN